MQTGQAHIVGTDPADNLQIDVNSNIFYHKDDAVVKRELLSVEFLEPAEFLQLITLEILHKTKESKDLKNLSRAALAVGQIHSLEFYDAVLTFPLNIITNEKTIHLKPYCYERIGHYNFIVEDNEDGYAVIVVWNRYPTRTLGKKKYEYDEIARVKSEKMAEDLTAAIYRAIHNENIKVFDVEEWLSEHEND